MNHKKLFYRGIKSLKNSLGRLGFVMGLVVVQSRTGVCAELAARNPGTFNPLRNQQAAILKNQIDNHKDVQARRKNWEEELKQAETQLKGQQSKPDKDQDKAAINQLNERIKKAKAALDDEDPNPPKGYEKTGGLKAEEKKLEDQIKNSEATMQKLGELEKSVQDAKANLEDYSSDQIPADPLEGKNLSDYEAGVNNAETALGEELNKIDTNGNGVHDLAEPQKAFDANKTGTPVGESPAQTPEQNTPAKAYQDAVKARNVDFTNTESFSPVDGHPGYYKVIGTDQIAFKGTDGNYYLAPEGYAAGFKNGIAGTSEHMTGLQVIDSQGNALSWKGGGNGANGWSHAFGAKGSNATQIWNSNGGGSPTLSAANAQSPGYWANLETGFSNYYSPNGQLFANGKYVGNNLGVGTYQNPLTQKVAFTYNPQAPLVTTTQTVARTVSSAVGPAFSWMSPSTWWPAARNFLSSQ